LACGKALTSNKVRGAGASPVARRHDVAAAPAFSERQFRDAMAQFATGVAVICAPGPPNRFVGFSQYERKTELG